MAQSNQRLSTLPVKIQEEYLSVTRDGKSHFKRMKWPNDYQVVSTVREVDLTINDTNSGSILFTEALKSGFTSPAGYQGVLTGGTSRFFRNIGNVSSTTTVSALYEHVRGYLYRDFGVSGSLKWNNYLSTTAGLSGLIISKTLSSASHAAVLKGSGASGTHTAIPSITACRIIAMNRSFYKDRIKPGTWRMRINPTNVNLATRRGLDFENDLITDLTSSGMYASITGMAGLTGSLSAGISGSVLTGLTIMIRIKPTKSGPPKQTLFHWRMGDPSQSAINWDSTTNNTLVQQEYRLLNPLSAVVTLPANATVTNGVIIFNNNTFSSTSNASTISGSSSALFKLTNVGGGILRWAASSNFSYLKLKYANMLPVLNPSLYNDGSTPLRHWSDQTAIQMVNQVNASGVNCGAVYNTVFGPAPGGNDGRLRIWEGANGYGTTTSNTECWQAISIPNGSSGLIVSFDLASTGCGGILTAFQTNVQKIKIMIRQCIPGGSASGTLMAASSDSISTFLESHSEGQIGNPGTWLRKSYHCNLIYQSPTWEWGGQYKTKYQTQTPSAWVGFTIDSGTGIDQGTGIGQPPKEYHLANVKIEVVPSTIYGSTNLDSSTATVTAYFDSSVTSYISRGSFVRGSIVFYPRDRNFEKSPNFPITQELRLYDGLSVWGTLPAES